MSVIFYFIQVNWSRWGKQITPAGKVPFRSRAVPLSLSQRNGSVEIGGDNNNNKRPVVMCPLWQTGQCSQIMHQLLDTDGVNRVWRDLHGAVQSNAACFGDDIILITSHTGWAPKNIASPAHKPVYLPLSGPVSPDWARHGTCVLW